MHLIISQLIMKYFSSFMLRVKDFTSKYTIEKFPKELFKIQIGKYFINRNLRLSGYSSTNRSSCHLLIKWTIPSGIYADPYQLQPFIDNQTLRFADGVNIESMEHHSPEIVFYTNEKLDCQNVCRFSKSIPIHVRYHLPNRRQASNDLSALVNLVPPSIYSSCGNGKHCFDENEPSCNWERMKSSPIDGEQRTHISIPVGDLSHSVIVAFMTLLTTSVGTICVAKEV